MATPNASRSGRPRAAPYLFLAPATFFFLAFLALPIAYTVWLSFHALHVSGLGLGGDAHQVFVGLQNYRTALSDHGLWAGLLRVLAYGAIVLPVMLGAALVLALLLDCSAIRLRRFGRVA